VQVFPLSLEEIFIELSKCTEEATASPSVTNFPPEQEEANNVLTL